MTPGTAREPIGQAGIQTDQGGNPASQGGNPAGEAGNRAPHAGPRLVAGMRWLVAAVLLGFVLARVDIGDVASRLAAANLVLAGTAVAGLVAVQAIGAWSWRRLLRYLGGVDVGVRPALGLQYAAQAIGFLTPGNLGADVYRVAALSASGRRAAATPVLVQRVASTVALALLAAIAALNLPHAGVLPTQPLGAAGVQAVLAVLAVLALVAVIAITAVVWAIVSRRWPRAPQRPGAAPRARVRATLALASITAGLRRGWRSVLVDGLGLGLLFHVASLGLGLLAVVAIDPPSVSSQPLGVLAALTVARLWLVIPISPSGIGVQEGALAVLFVQLGLDPGVAIAALALNRIALLVTVALGAGAIAATGGWRRRGSTPSRPTEPQASIVFGRPGTSG